MTHKLYRGKKRLAMRYLNYHYHILQWAMSRKVGDYFASCQGCNRKIAKIEPQWINEGEHRRGRKNKTTMLDGVMFTDTHGNVHFCPGGGCALPAETAEQVTAYFKERYLAYDIDEETRRWVLPEQLEACLERNRKFKEALSSGKPIVDEHGELLPEFDHH